MARDLPIFLLAAGGTGGHMFPAEALARALLGRGAHVELVTDRRGHAFGDQLPEVPVHRVHAAAPGAGFLGKLKAGLVMGRGLLQSGALIRHLRPDAVVGFGGYPSVPAVYAAAQAKVPVLLHEQNAVLGRANRLLVPGAARIATAFPEVSGVKPAHRAKIIRTGNPVRPPIAAQRHAAYQPPAADGPVRLLVMGGSQGARVFSEVVPAALARLPESLRARIHLSQQCRPEDLEEARAAYAGIGLGSVDLQSFFRDVPERMAGCHLAITRSGASTVAELTCIGRPAILVPYPHAMDDHQTANARAVVDAGAGWLVPQPAFVADALADRLTDLLVHPDNLAVAAAAAHAWGMDDAAGRLADAVYALADIPTEPPTDATEAAE
ncbi:undecaprenyldiphospho-muramoylpentapeptide beta-N-acetylglucosaminyltransferase [Azospirillum sp. RWY-5-1]|uniref:UDP-N-acetylglucosamine--N-acetylmuramyl-(pentapeptide) pyrophosphoryl-undecaprenol N-acetylglucosamine transferase n=1 Tax=Azospirillum oleiclasticum TaxID=2735135 RepID=A0ABX2TCF6_9PROT|nr:undecaprenyldiphospho-muramoylpentapeptide beta-N-acetylglucosaminyltransferase [Azospirillum oleiclasticum]NYZ15720.1 undecaprenyldiphospho-muramoylpentapeptide beta-N-acetylglucosaminyltransferase [Azospirillum oleiclasticum]NYZ21990.1 undecaprenyldiphospho-muramoylpentapeptide beta-N-acetylglucosaminyltransferase [Azospirillum oleiclasticum]